jgi:4-hydroxybutyrate dehydrogenase
MKPEIFKYATCKEFAEGFALGAEDLVLTNKFIFEPYFGPLGLKVHTIFQEEYGMGEPTDVMCESIMQDAAKTGCKRIIAIGGVVRLSTSPRLWQLLQKMLLWTACTV